MRVRISNLKALKIIGAIFIVSSVYSGSALALPRGITHGASGFFYYE